TRQNTRPPPPPPPQHTPQPKPPTPGAAPFAPDAAPRLDQQPDRLQIAVHCREMKRRSVVGKFAAVEISTARDEQTYSVVPVPQGGQMQRRGLLKPTTSQRIDEVRACIEPLPQRVNVS